MALITTVMVIVQGHLCSGHELARGHLARRFKATATSTTSTLHVRRYDILAVVVGEASSLGTGSSCWSQLRAGRTRDRDSRLAIPPLNRGNGDWWQVVDSNHCRRKPTDLQSAPIGHSGNLPC